MCRDTPKPHENPHPQVPDRARELPSSIKAGLSGSQKRGQGEKVGLELRNDRENVPFLSLTSQFRDENSWKMTGFFRPLNPLQREAIWKQST